MENKDRQSPVKKVGRPTVTNISLLNDILLQYKDRLIRENGSVVPKTNKVWEEISQKFSESLAESNCNTKPKTAKALYTYVMNRKNAIRAKLSEGIVQNHLDNESILGSENLNITVDVDSTFDISNSSVGDEDKFTFMIQVTGAEFDKLLETKIYRDKSRKDGMRKRLRFRKGNWTFWINEKLHTIKRGKCGYYFEYHHINQDGKSGHAVGRCDCGSSVNLYLQRNEFDVMNIKCVTTEGKQKKKCGKVYLRGEERHKTGQILQTKAPYIFRAERAAEIMRDKEPEPSIIPKSTVLRTAKSEYSAKHHLDPDPVKSLHLMKLTSHKDIIYNMGLSPFYVHYSSKHQDTIYRTIAARENVSISIDATGSIIRPNVLPNKATSRVIFLYVIVVQTISNGSFPVAQMLSECHTTSAICHWLTEWISHTGLPNPKVVTSDGALAIIAAVIRVFAHYATIIQYVEALWNGITPPCYVRTDVAHFLKKYANFLKEERVEIKRFYLASIGKLIKCETISEAESIVNALLTIALSKSDGLEYSGIPSVCQVQKDFMEEFLTGEIETPEDYPEDSIPDEENDESSESTNGWYEWAFKIKENVESKIELSTGKGVNAHWSENFAKKLMEDLKFLPLWSSVVRGKFGFGREQASSAASESQFRNIKSLLLKNESLPMRSDDFVTLHCKYISGVARLYDDALTSDNEETSPVPEQSDDGYEPHKNATRLSEISNKSRDENDPPELPEEDVFDDIPNPKHRKLSGEK